MNENLIVMIDSGVDLLNQKMMEHVVGGCSFEFSYEENKVIRNILYQDEYGRGSNSIDFILHNKKDIQFYVIKVINKFIVKMDELLIEALRECTSIPAKIICVNISVLVEDSFCKKEMEKICTILKGQGKIICVASNSGFEDAIPACFTDVIGVKAKSAFEDNFIYVDNRDVIQIKADGSPVFVQGIQERYNFFDGNAKANALIVSEIMELTERFKSNDMEDILERLKTCEERSVNIKIFESKQVVDLETVKKINKAIGLIGQPENICNHEYTEIFDDKTGINNFNFIDLLLLLYREFNIEVLDHHNISKREIETVNKLALHIAKYRNRGSPLDG